MYCFNVLTEQNLGLLKPAPKSGQALNYSVLRQVEHASTFRGFSISYVREGLEHYTVNGREYRVGPGGYLLTNPHCAGKGYIDSRTPVHGLCIDLLPETVAEVLAGICHPDDPDLEIDLPAMLGDGDFFEYHCRSGESELGHVLTRFTKQIGQGKPELPQLDDAFFYRLVELYLADYRQILKRLSSMPAVKSSTRKDRLRLLLKGKDFMDDCFSNELRICDVAKASNMSVYHFFRLFRAAFGITPHQYLWQKRLRAGQELLCSGRHSVYDIALRCGFADLSSFSKAYKKQFGVSPSKYKN